MPDIRADYVSMMTRKITATHDYKQASLQQMDEYVARLNIDRDTQVLAGLRNAKKSSFEYVEEYLDNVEEKLQEMFGDLRKVRSELQFLKRLKAQ